MDWDGVALRKATQTIRERHINPLKLAPMTMLMGIIPAPPEWVNACRDNVLDVMDQEPEDSKRSTKTIKTKIVDNRYVKVDGKDYKVDESYYEFLVKFYSLPHGFEPRTSQKHTECSSN